jgi:hypothetical protein
MCHYRNMPIEREFYVAMLADAPCRSLWARSGTRGSLDRVLRRARSRYPFRVYRPISEWTR